MSLEGSSRRIDQDCRSAESEGTVIDNGKQWSDTPR